MQAKQIHEENMKFTSHRKRKKEYLDKSRHTISQDNEHMCITL